MALSAPDMDRLVKLLDMLGSAFAGERAAAGAMADKLVRNAGITWNDVVKPKPLPPHQSSKPEPEPKPEPKTKWTNWRELARACLNRESEITDWEYEFLDSILMRSWSQLTPKQDEVLQRIARKLGYETSARY